MFSKKTLRKIRKLFLFVVFVFFAELSFPADAYSQKPIISQKVIMVGSYQRKEPVVLKLPEIKDKPRPAAKRVVNLTVTAYSSTPDQTDGDPFTTASGSKVRNGVIAANFLPMGTNVRFPEKFGDKIFVVEDRMHPRHRYMADIWMPSREQAKQWGAKYLKMEIL